MYEICCANSKENVQKEVHDSCSHDDVFASASKIDFEQEKCSHDRAKQLNTFKDFSMNIMSANSQDDEQ